MKIKQILKERLPLEKRLKLRYKLLYIKAWFFARKLNKLAQIWKTDKWDEHWYTQHYQFYFKKYRKRKIKLLEIGVGGYDSPIFGGNSLRMWKSYFRRGKIHAIDIYDKSKIQEKRIKIEHGSQTDKDLLKKLSDKYGPFDIIIDDGSHVNEHIIITFKTLFPLLNTNGIYVVEDMETSYWQDYGGDSINLNNPDTAINYFKSLVDCLNHKEIVNPEYKPGYFDLNIVSVHFYHNMVFIQKGQNLEESVHVIDNKIYSKTPLKKN